MTSHRGYHRALPVFAGSREGAPLINQQKNIVPVLPRSMRFRNTSTTKFALSGRTGKRIMMLLLELAAMLVVGFVFGRIWQVRHQLLLDEDVRRRLNESGVTIRERPQAIDSKSSMLSDRRNNNFPVTPTSTLHFHADPGAYAGRFHGLHKSLQHVRASSM